MGSKRNFGCHVRWTDDEKQTLATHYPSSSWEVITDLLPGRTVKQIQGAANLLGLKRPKPPKMSEAERLEKKRVWAAKRREENPELCREQQRNYHIRNRERQTEQMRLYAKRRFFWNRARGLKGAGKATTKDLASLWKTQRGLCALTGRKLDRDAQLDHRLPRARGGSDEISNLRWVCKEVNLAKRDLTDDEFYHLCADMMMWAGLQLEGAM